MKTYYIIAISIASIVFFAIACTPEKDPVCIRTASGTINEPPIFPDSVALGDSIIGQFKVTGHNGCSQFIGFESYLQEDAIFYHRFHVPNTIIKDIGCVCTEIVPTFDATYSFYPSDTGMYTINYIIYGDIIQYDSVYVY